MNAMEQAFVSAGVPVKPLSERVWRIIKDRGPLLVRDVASMMHIEYMAASRTMSRLKCQGMLTSEPDNKGRRGPPRLRYTAVGSSYEEALACSTPVHKPKPSVPKLTVVTPTPAPQSAPPVADALAGALGTLPPALLALPLADLHKVYRTLHELFGA